MGGRHSKRSVDISGGGNETGEAQPLDGKLEKLDEGSKAVVNGASHSEQHDEQVSNGDPVGLPEQVAEEAGPSSPSDEVQPETAPVSELIQPPKKKEKVKKKWSLRSLSFSKKDKSKPGKEDPSKEDAEVVQEVTEEKAEEATSSFLSSVTETISSTTEAVADAVVAAEHKVEEGLTATQDQVEKISAKVAEKAEALVVKMEAMTVQAVDSAQEMIGLGRTTAAEVEKAEIAVPDAAVTNVKLPEVEVTTAALPEAPKIEPAVTEIVEVGTVLAGESVSKLVEPFATNITVPEPITLEPVLPESVTKVTLSQEQGASNDVLSLKAGLTGILSEVSMIVVNEHDIPATTEVEVSVLENTVTKAEEMPPPLPASPPPSTVVEEVVAEVIDVELQLGETQVVTSGPGTSISVPLSPNTIHVPPALIEIVHVEDIGGGGGDEPRQSMGASVVAEIITEVIQIAERSLTTQLSNQQQENDENEENNDNQGENAENEPTHGGSSQSATGSSDKNNQPGPPPNESAEE